ncbi:uncharacterized protein [Argopecten irradians]|uniref:uncharacterized protein n=1 Tax=Argopecten irradians TaxID=31199 RepID=UPI003714F332
MIRLLIDKGADIKKSDALSKAISFGHGDIVSLLLENGDDPEKLSEEHMLRMTEVIARHQENVRLQQQEYSKGISGTVENPCNITIAVVGHQGVGKSCLVKQLIRESIPEGGPGSTDTAISTLTT